MQMESELESVVAVLVRAESVNKLENKIQTEQKNFD